MRALIFDSNPEDAEQLARMLCTEDPGITIEGKFSTVQSAFEWLGLYGQPDIIFMEVYLTDGLSFEILNFLDDHVKVVFTLAYHKSAMEVFENQSICFMIKPFVQDQLKDVLAARQKHINRIELYEALLSVYFPRPVKKVLRRIIVKKGSEFQVITINDIVYFASDNGIVYFVTGDNQRYIISGTLQDVYSQLENNLFYRANRNFIINSSYLKGFRRVGYKIMLTLTVPCKEEIYVNNYRVTEFKCWLEGSRTGMLVEI
jgi:two-component system response regulator LytT